MPQPAPGSTPQTYNALVSAFTSLLTITVHTLLYTRSLYPPTTFLTARAYNTPVHQSRHPGVCAWVNSAVAAVAAQLLKCSVARVAFVIFEGEGKGRVLERWVWDLSGWPEVPKEEGETVLVREGAEGAGHNTNANGNGNIGKVNPSTSIGKYTIDMEEQFRALLTSLSHLPSSSPLSPLPAHATFTLCIEQRDQAPAPIGHPQPWIPSQPDLQATVVERGNEGFGGDVRREVKKGEALGGLRTVPVRRVEAGEMRFEVWVEEGKAKFEEAEARSTGQDSSM